MEISEYFFYGITQVAIVLFIVSIFAFAYIFLLHSNHQSLKKEKNHLDKKIIEIEKSFQAEKTSEEPKTKLYMVYLKQMLKDTVARYKEYGTSKIVGYSENASVEAKIAALRHQFLKAEISSQGKEESLQWLVFEEELKSVLFRMEINQGNLAKPAITNTKTRPSNANDVTPANAKAESKLSEIQNITNEHSNILDSVKNRLSHIKAMRDQDDNIKGYADEIDTLKALLAQSESQVGTLENQVKSIKKKRDAHIPLDNSEALSSSNALNRSAQNLKETNESDAPSSEVLNQYNQVFSEQNNILHKLHTQLESIAQDIDQPDAIISQASQLKKLINLLEESNSYINDLEKELLNAKDEVNSNFHEIKRLKRETTQIEGLIVGFTRDNKDMITCIHTLEEEVKFLRGRLDRKEANKQDTTRDSEQIKELEGLIAGFSNESRDMMTCIQTLEDECNSLREQRNKAQLEAEVTESDSVRIAELQSLIDQFTKDSSEMLECVNSLEVENERLRQELTQLQRRLRA